jgi:hypothetical protein
MMNDVNMGLQQFNNIFKNYDTNDGICQSVLKFYLIVTKPGESLTSFYLREWETHNLVLSGSLALILHTKYINRERGLPQDHLHLSGSVRYQMS